MAASRKSPRDATGRKAAELAEKHAAELSARANEISTINPLPEVVVEDPQADEVTVSTTVEVAPQNRQMRVNTDLEDVTIGRGYTKSFKRGVVYTVPDHVYRHLDEKGYVHH